MTASSARHRAHRTIVEAIADRVLTTYLDARDIFVLTRRTLTLLG